MIGDRGGSINKVCQNCGVEFSVYKSRERADPAKFCSMKCYRHKSPFERLMEGIDKNGPLPPNGSAVGRCWIWTKGRSKCGYGKIQIDGKAVLVHRFSYELHNGPLGKLFCCHKCDTPLCANPDHLFAGSHNDNMSDMLAKNRHWAPSGDDHALRKNPERAARGKRHGSYLHPERTPRGEAVTHSKLTNGNVLEIRSSKEKLTVLAERYGVSISTISLVRNRKVWNHL